MIRQAMRAGSVRVGILVISTKLLMYRSIDNKAGV